MDLQTHREDLVMGEDRSWLAMRAGMDECRPVVLDLDSFTFPDATSNHVIPSGTRLMEDTTTGRYVPYAVATLDPDAHVGLLFSSVEAKAGNHDGVAAGALFWRGAVRVNRLPDDTLSEAVDDGFVAALPTVRFEQRG